MGKAEVIADLRRLTGAVELVERECWPAPSLSSGVAKGIIAELTGNAKTEWLLELFKMNPDTFIFWIEQHQSVNPVAVQQRGVNLERVKFVNSFENLHQPLRIALESQYYPLVVCPQVFTEIKMFQRFQLLTERSKSTLFLLAKENHSNAWPISFQAEISYAPEGYQIEVHRQKHGQKHEQKSEQEAVQEAEQKFKQIHFLKNDEVSS